MHNFIVILNKDGIITHFEDNNKMLGYLPEEVLFKNWFDIFINEVNKEGIIQVFHRLFEEEITKNLVNM